MQIYSVHSENTELFHFYTGDLIFRPKMQGKNLIFFGAIKSTSVHKGLELQLLKIYILILDAKG